MNKTNIAWTDYTWNPVTGCTEVSAGCQNCYARAMAKRFNGGDFTVKLHQVVLAEKFPKKPSKIFICSMSDLFHNDVPDSFIGEISRKTYSYPQHTFQILTKRAERLLAWSNKWKPSGVYGFGRNVHIGVTVENQEMADKRIPLLLRIPAVVRFLSIEPCLGPIDLRYIKWAPIDTSNWPQKGIVCHSCYDCIAKPEPITSDTIMLSVHQELGRIEWVIVGCESGAGRRPCKIEWVESLVEQCKYYGVPVFVKQLEIAGKVTGDITKFPKHLQIRQWPKEAK